MFSVRSYSIRVKRRNRETEASFRSRNRRRAGLESSTSSTAADSTSHGNTTRGAKIAARRTVSSSVLPSTEKKASILIKQKRSASITVAEGLSNVKVVELKDSVSICPPTPSSRIREIETKFDDESSVDDKSIPDLNLKTSSKELIPDTVKLNASSTHHCRASELNENLSTAFVSFAKETSFAPPSGYPPVASVPSSPKTEAQWYVQLIRSVLRLLYPIHYEYNIS